MGSELAEDLAAIARLDAIPTILRTIRETTGLRLTLVARVLPDRWVACAVHDEIDFGLGVGGELDVATTLCREVRDSHQPIVIDHVTDDPAYCHHPTPKRYGFESYIAVPIFRASGEYFGNICGLDPLPRPLNDGKTLETVKLFSRLISLQLDADERHQKSLAEAKREHETAVARQRVAEAASAAMDQFLATVSHELRTPLNAMLGWARLLLSGDLPPNESRRAVVTIERNATLQARLVDELLDVSRVVTGKMHVDVRSVELVGLVEAALESARPAASAKGVTVGARFDAAPFTIQADAARLQQVLWNLLTNAVKFTHAGGRVDVTMRGAASDVEIEVTDTGEGIEAPLLAHVFDRFRQAEGSSARGHGGLGLGLSIAKAIVEMHGGSIDARSAGKGHGSTFRVRLPREGTSAEPEPERAPESATAPVAKRELRDVAVLVVDDDEDSLELLAALLTDAGARVRTARGVDEAMQAFVDDPPQIVVSDIAMPESDGYALVRRVREHQAQGRPPVPVVAVTAYARPEDRAKASRGGFDSYVQKPFSAEEILAAITSLLPHRGPTGSPAAA